MTTSIAPTSSYVPFPLIGGQMHHVQLSRTPQASAISRPPADIFEPVQDAPRRGSLAHAASQTMEPVSPKTLTPRAAVDLGEQGDPRPVAFEPNGTPPQLNAIDKIKSIGRKLGMCLCGHND